MTSGLRRLVDLPASEGITGRGRRTYRALARDRAPWLFENDCLAGRNRRGCGVQRRHPYLHRRPHTACALRAQRRVGGIHPRGRSRPASPSLSLPRFPFSPNDSKASGVSRESTPALRPPSACAATFWSLTSSQSSATGTPLSISKQRNTSTTMPGDLDSAR